MTKPSREELMEIGKRAARKGLCQSVTVAPDHTGEDNYHNCVGSPNHEGVQHGCGCGLIWD